MRLAISLVGLMLTFLALSAVRRLLLRLAGLRLLGVRPLRLSHRPPSHHRAPMQLLQLHPLSSG